MRPTQQAATPTVLAWAAVASMGAGAVHATAAGVHGEHRQAAVAFAVLAAFQVGWGALALAWPRRGVAAVGALGNAVALGGWLAAMTVGIGAIDGLEAAEDPAFADTAAAVLAGLAVIGAGAGALAPAGRRPRPRLPGLFGPVPVAAATAVVVVAALVTVTGDDHAGGGHVAAGAGDHAHGDGTDGDGAAEGGGGHQAAPVPPEPFDGTLPVDLGGVPGVSPEQQARAEALLTANVEKLPRFADTAAALAAGYTPIGDAGTGVEHYINWSLIGDGRQLDAEYPESLVYRVGARRQRTLEAAMYVLEPGSTLDTVPDVGGPLVQFHVHNDLCWRGSGDRYQVIPAAEVPAPCPAGFERKLLEPMMHVWIVAHPCGPFAALEGISGGQVQEGEAVACDHAHGSG
ncbi:MAG TPA: hypothetical protein VFM27_00020 [Acidimicrobiales bacterium]|nr:hypothetical protein [Acidimicrobiales bacterium]